MNTLRAGSTVWYKGHSAWGLGHVRWITPTGLLMVRFEDGAEGVYEGEFGAGELTDATPLEATA